MTIYNNITMWVRSSRLLCSVMSTWADMPDYYKTSQKEGSMGMAVWLAGKWHRPCSGILWVIREDHSGSGCASTPEISAGSGQVPMGRSSLPGGRVEPGK